MKKKLLIIGLVLTQILTLNAQDTLKNQTLQKIKTAFQSDYFRLTGYGQLVYNYTQHPAPNTANNSLDVARAILIAAGKVGKNQQFGYTLMFDFGSNDKLYELYGEWTPLKAVNLRIGQQKVPFTIENPMSLALIETIKLSRSASAMCGSTGDVNMFDINGNNTGVKTGRDLGVELYGQLFRKKEQNFYQLEYYAGVFNGAGFNTKDVDNSKDIAAAAYYQPVKGLRIGGSVYFGKYYDNARKRWSFGAEYNGKRFYSRAEGIAACDGDLRRKGYYGLLVWKIEPNKWEILGKYDFYKPDTGIANSGISDITAGANYYFAPLCRIQLNYVHAIDALQGNNNTLLTQLQLFF